MQSAEKLGFRFETEIISGEQSTLVYFPEDLKNCRAGRVQTLLTDASGSGVSVSSMDYQVGSSKPSVLVSFNPETHDILFQVQYCCSGSPYPGCKISYSIQSLKGKQ